MQMVKHKEVNMYKIIKDGKIVAVSDTDTVFGLNYDTIEEDTIHTIDDYDQYNGEYLLKSEIPAPTQEEQSEKRAQAYLIEIDPITAHIQRLRDEEPESEKIAELLSERAEKVAEIKEMYPYPVEE